jgi:hypothetical protein
VSIDCNDPVYPLQADILYSENSQGAYGNVSKIWTIDRSVSCGLGPAGSRFKGELNTNIDLSIEAVLIGRFKEDIRFNEEEEARALTNVLVTNVVDRDENLVYIESSGVRKDKATLFELATVTPHIGPFGGVEYYRVILRRSENQSIDL